MSSYIKPDTQLTEKESGCIRSPTSKDVISIISLYSLPLSINNLTKFSTFFEDSGDLSPPTIDTLIGFLALSIPNFSKKSRNCSSFK